MANEGRKDFNKQMNNSRDMPKIVDLDEKQAQKWGGSRMVIAPPLDYDTLMRKVSEGKLLTTDAMRNFLAKKYNADLTCPLTCGIFVNICAWASFQRESDKTPYWRTLKTGGELNEKYPGGIETQKALLEAEGHIIIQKGRSKIRYFVKDYENSRFEL